MAPPGARLAAMAPHGARLAAIACAAVAVPALAALSLRARGLSRLEWRLLLDGVLWRLVGLCCAAYCLARDKAERQTTEAEEGAAGSRSPPRVAEAVGMAEPCSSNNTQGVPPLAPPSVVLTWRRKVLESYRTHSSAHAILLLLGGVRLGAMLPHRLPGLLDNAPARFGGRAARRLADTSEALPEHIVGPLLIHAALVVIDVVDGTAFLETVFEAEFERGSEDLLAGTAAAIVAAGRARRAASAGRRVGGQQHERGAATVAVGRKGAGQRTACRRFVVKQKSS